MSHVLRTPVVCGVDIGSTNTKVVALDPSGIVVARAGRPTPRDASDRSIHGDALFSAVEEMVAKVCSDRFVLHAVCVAGVGEDGVLVDAVGAAMLPALAWFDERRQEVFRRLRPSLLDDESFDVETDAVRTLVGWAWARGQAVSARAHRWVALADLPAVRWSERAFISDTLASRTAAWRSDRRSWDAARVESTLGSFDLLPPVVATGEIVGEISSSALRELGALAADAVVVAGGHDHPIAGWGVEQMIPGAVLDSMGTAEVVVAQSPARVTARRDHVDLAPGIRSPGSTLLRVEELARNVQWASRDPEVAACIRLLLDGVKRPAQVWEHGYFSPGKRGGGEPAYAPGAPVAPHLRASAVLGALAVAGRDAVDAVRAGLPGSPDVRLAGGWVRSPGWIELKSDVGGVRAAPILEPEVTAVGAALLAARARGWSPDPHVALGGFASGLLG